MKETLIVLAIGLCTFQGTVLMLETPPVTLSRLLSGAINDLFKVPIVQASRSTIT